MSKKYLPIIVLVVALSLVALVSTALAGWEVDTDSESCSITNIEVRIVAEWQSVHLDITITSVSVGVLGHESDPVVVVTITGETESGEIQIFTIQKTIDGCENLRDGYECQQVSSDVRNIERVLAEYRDLDIDVSFEEWVEGPYPWFYARVQQLNITIDYIEVRIVAYGEITRDGYLCTLTTSTWFPSAVTFMAEGNGALRTNFPTQVYYISPADHPALHEGLLTDPFGTVASSTYLGEWVSDGTYDYLRQPGGGLSFLLAPYSPDGNYLVLVCGVENPGECVFGAYWSVSDPDGNGESEGEMLTHATDYLTGAWSYTNQPAQ